MRHRRARQAQSTIEMMLYISVIVIALTATAYVFIGPLDQGYDRMSDDAMKVLPETMQKGANERR